MNMISNIAAAPADACATAFPAALNHDEWQEMEKVCHGFGVNRRIVILMATKDRNEMAEVLRKLDADDDADGEENALDAMLDIVSDYRAHVEQMVEFARMVEARVLIAAHDALGVTFEETAPRVEA